MFYTARVIDFVGLLALAASLPLSEREARSPWTPRILYPNQYTRWCARASHTVHWDPSKPPAVITDRNAKLYLVTNGQADMNNPLASDFPLAAGVVRITVPDVFPGKYQLELYGDSDNRSDPFEINQC